MKNHKNQVIEAYFNYTSQISVSRLCNSDKNIILISYFKTISLLFCRIFSWKFLHRAFFTSHKSEIKF